MSGSTQYLRKYLRTYCHVNALGPDWQATLARTLLATKDQEGAEEFRRQLKSAIIDGALSLAEFEATTGWGLDSAEDMHEWLVNLWREISGDHPSDD